MQQLDIGNLYNATLKKENDEKSFWMIVGIAAAALVGVVAH